MSCLVCGADAARPRFEIGRQINRPEPFSILQCARCGFQWASPTPSPEELVAYYAKGDGYVHYVRAGALKRLHFAAKLDELREFLPAPGRMLDVGCAAGFLIESARALGWDAFGVELNQGMAAVTAPETRARVTYGELRELPLEPRFRLITLFDVLEHTPDPAAVLRACRDRLEPGGVLVAQLPCTDSLQCRLLGRRWYHYGPPGHLSYFDDASLRRLSERTGFRVLGARWTRKLFTVDYLVAQLAHEYAKGLTLPRLPLVGAARLFVPMSERLFVLSPTAA